MHATIETIFKKTTHLLENPSDRRQTIKRTWFRVKNTKVELAYTSIEQEKNRNRKPEVTDDSASLHSFPLHVNSNRWGTITFRGFSLHFSNWIVLEHFLNVKSSSSSLTHSPSLTNEIPIQILGDAGKKVRGSDGKCTPVVRTSRVAKHCY
jgi:hypothetical protein